MSTAFDPKTAKPVSASTKSVEAFDPTTAKPVEEVTSRGLKGWAQDAAATGVKAALAVPEAAVGVADLVTGGKAGKALEGAGVRFKEAREIADGWHSDVTKAQKAEFQNADGVAGKAAVALSNPSLIAMAVGESLGAMGAGGAIGRGAMAATRLGQMGAKGAAIAGAAGEGVVGAGSAAEQIRQQTADGELTAKQAALAAGTGLATGALGFAGNKVANRLGIGDADMMLAQGTKGMAKDAAERATAAAVNPLAQPAQKSILRQMGEGAITEGVLEELPQSVSEQILQNEALGKSWSDGLDDAIVMGILSGGAMGASAAGYRGFKDKQIDDAAANARNAAANAPGAAPGQDQAASAVRPAAWTTSAGAAAEVEPGTAPASPANAPNLDYETLPGAAPEAVGKEIPFEREFDTGGLSLQSTQPAAVPPVLDHDALRDKAGVMMPPQLDSGRIEVETGLQPLSNEQPPRQWDTGNLSLVGEGQPQAPLSQRMGLDPKAGALSKAAAMAVDSGASPVLQPQAAQVAEQQQAAPQVPAGVDPDTGEVSLQAQMDELKSRIAFMNQQGATQGWDGNRAAQRNALQTQLTRLELQAAAGQGRGASTAGAPAPVQLTGINQILAKQVPDMNEQELQQAIAHYGPNHKRTKKLEKALQALAQKPLTAIESGANGNVSQADQTQQGSAQPAQTGAAQAGQDAGQGVGNGTTPTANPGAQDQGASLAKAQAKVSEAAGAAQAAVGKAAQIAREGNAEREAQRQRQLDASERWTRMTTVERQAVTATAPGLNPIARKNLHTRAWPDIGEKIRDKLLDSLVEPLVAPASKTPDAAESVASAAPSAVSAEAPAKPAAQPVGDEKQFAAETGTLGIPRAEMPQVPTANHGGLVKHLNAQGIAHETTTVDAAQLKPTQAEYSPSKVEAAKSATGDRAVIVSSDGHIIDGHHQAVAAAEEGKQVKAIVLDAPVEQALAAVKASPSVNADGRNHFTLERMNHSTGEMESVTFERGQTIKIAIGRKPYGTGVITGIAHPVRKFKVDGGKHGLDFGYAYPAEYDEFAAPRAEVDEALDGLAKRLESENSSDAQATIDRARKIIDQHNLGDYAKDRMAELLTKAGEVSKSVLDKMKAAKARRDAEDAKKRAEEQAAKKPLPDVVMTMDEWKAEHKDFKSIVGGQRMVLREGGMRKVLIEKPKGIPAKAREAMATRADYFTPGNIVNGYGNTFDRVIAYNPPDEQGRWSVTVQEVKRQGDAWAAVPNEGERTHSTQPGARDLKAGPVEREASETADGARFRREAAETAAGADFDVASFLQGMNEGQPAAAAVAQAPTTNVRPSYSPAARAEAVRAVKGTADAIRQAWANGPEVIVAFDMQDSLVPESARRADLKQRSGGARGAPEGFYYQGKVYLMASKLKTPNDAARVLFHEALGHHGLRGLFGKDLGLILNQVATMRKADVDAKIAEYGLRRVNRLDRRTAAEEVLAEMAQNTPQIGFVRRAVAAIRTWLRTNVPGFKSLALTDDELIRNFILPARAWVERGGSVAGVDGGASFSRDSREAPQTDVEKALVLQGEPVANLDTAIAPMGAPAIRSWAADLFEQQGGMAHSPVLGDVLIDERSVRSSIAHGRPNEYKVAAFAAVKDVIEKGAVVLSAAHGKTDSYYVSAPVRISGTDHIVTALVHRDAVTQRMYLHSVATKKYLLDRRVSRAGAEAPGRSGSNDSGDTSTVTKQRDVGKASTEEVADELHRLLTLDTNAEQGDAGEPMFSRSRFMDLKDSALDQLAKTFTHEGKVSWWDTSIGTMRHLAERNPFFKPVYESAQQNIDDVSMLANDAADMAPRILPRVESLGDLKKKPVSAADNKAVARPLFEGTLIWARDENGKPTLVDDLQKRYANLSAHNKAAMLLKHGKIKSEVLAMWQGLPVAQFEKNINARFENKMLKPGIVWSDAELQAQFGTDANQISLYREARAAIDRSIDMTARTDMLRIVGEKYEPMRDAVLAQPSVEAAAQLLLDTLEQDAKADPDSRDRLAGYMQLINRRLDTAVDLQQGGYAPLSRFGRYTVDVVDANGERLYFGMYETARDSNRAKMQLEHEFKGATVTTGTMSAEAYKLFAGVTPETLEQFGEMLGLKAEGNEAQDKAFQEFLKLTKNNHSAMKRLIHRKGIAGFSEDVGRVVANFVYSNARAGAMGLNAGKMETAIGKIPKEQGELKDLAMGLRDYIRDPQEEGQAVRGMLFAQYLGGSIASAFVNTTQPFAVTLPWLSQYGGMKKAGAQLAGALKDMGTKGFKYEADLAKALQSAEDDGVVSPQEIHQLMAQARGAGMLRSGDGTKAGNLRAEVSNKWEQGKVLWGQPLALAEQFNRRSTFIASYRIAKDQGMADPAAFARKAVLETQFVYSKANKPQWARGAVGGTIFTFKTYSVSYLELMQRMWNQPGPEGKRAVGWALAMLLLMSGAGGVPFMEDAEDLIDGAGQMMGYNISAKQWRKELLASVVGKELGEFMEQGLSGLPGAPIDVSGRLGMGNLLPGTGLFLDKPNRERDMTEIIGPAGDLVARGFSGARQVAKGVANWDASAVGRGVLEWAPTAVRNLAKGADMAATGMYRDTKGYKVIDTTLAEAAAKAIGFQPKSVAEVQEANSFMQRSKSFYTQTSSEIKAQWADALFRKDEAAVQRVRERLADWNRDNPEQPIVVKMPDVWKRVREMGKDRSDRIADSAPKALRQQMREQVANL